MTNDSFLSLACISLFGLFFGFVLIFGGYRFFLILLPIWGFVFGFGLGAQAVQALLGTGFLSTVTSWLVGFFLAAIFAVLSYLVWYFGVALLAGALGDSIGVSLMLAIGIDFGLVTWLVGMVGGLVFAAGALLLSLPKWIIIIATSILGAGVVVGTFVFMFGGMPAAELMQNPVRHVLQTSPFWFVVFFVLAGLGIAIQYQSTRTYEMDTYNRLVV